MILQWKTNKNLDSLLKMYTNSNFMNKIFPEVIRHTED